MVFLPAWASPAQPLLIYKVQKPFKLWFRQGAVDARVLILIGGNLRLLGLHQGGSSCQVGTEGLDKRERVVNDGLTQLMLKDVG